MASTRTSPAIFLLFILSTILVVNCSEDPTKMVHVPSCDGDCGRSMSGRSAYLAALDICCKKYGYGKAKHCSADPMAFCERGHLSDETLFWYRKLVNVKIVKNSNGDISFVDNEQ